MTGKKRLETCKVVITEYTAPKGLKKIEIFDEAGFSVDILETWHRNPIAEGYDLALRNGAMILGIEIIE